MLALLCCLGFSLGVEISSYSLAAGLRLLIMVASLVADLRLWCAQLSVIAACGLNSCCSGVLDHRLNSCGVQA